MKMQKISLVTAIVLSIVATSHSNSRFTTMTFAWTYVTPFFMGDASGPLDDPDKWSVSSGASCGGTGKMCEVVATWGGAPSQPIGEQDIISAVKAKYDELASLLPSSTFSDNYMFSVFYIYGVQVDFTIRLKS